MRYAICNEVFQDWPLARAFQFARECGYTGVEIAPFTLGANAATISSAKRQTVRQQADSAGLQVVGLHWLLAGTEGFYLTSPDREVRRRTADYFRQLACLCADLGGHVMVLGSPQQRNLLPGVSHDQALGFAAEVIQAVVPVLEQSDLVLAVEPLGPEEGDFLTTAAAGVELVQRVDSPHCRLHLDVKAMATESVPMPQLIRENSAYLAHFHANDPNRRGPGMGDVDFFPLIEALREIDYSGWVSVEVFDYEPGIERLVRDSIAYLQDVTMQ